MEEKIKMSNVKPLLEVGAQGADVEELQTLLKNKGYVVNVDGKFTPQTLSAVGEYQSDMGLVADGIVGDKTWSALLGGNKTTSSTSTSSSNSASGFKTPYKESDIVTEAKNALNAQLANKPGAYESQWQTQLNDTIDKILNREKFSYDLNGDALYQQYKDKYIQQGKMAMGDAIGQASAMTGGYGNSYAQSVGQQMYQKELQNLNDIIPELHQMAYDKYNQEGQDLLNQYAIVGDREDQDYGRYRDSYADWLSERDYLANRYDSERNFDYGKYVDDRNFDYGKYSDDRNFAYGKYADDKSYAYNEYRNAIADEQWEKEYALNALKGGNTVDKSGDTKVGGDLIPSAEPSTELPEGIVTKVQNYTTEKGQADYLADEVNKGNITTDQAVEILNQHGVTDLTSRRWEIVDDGGWDLFGIGIDADAKVRDENGKTYTLAELRKELKKTMSTKEANDYIKKLEKKLGI
jgi:hypothetical protein